MSGVPVIIALLLGLVGAILLGLPQMIRLVDYLMSGGERGYVLVPLLAALAVAVYVLHLLVRNRRRRLFLVFIIAMPLISTLHRRIEFTALGMEFYIETFLILLLTVYLWNGRKLRQQLVGPMAVAVAVALLVGLVSALHNQVLIPQVGWQLVQELILPFCCFLMAISMVRDRRDLDGLLRAMLASLLLFAALSLVWVFVLDQTIGLDVGQVLTAQTRLNSGARRLLVGAGFINAETGNRILILMLPLAVLMIKGRTLSRDNLLPLLAVLVSAYLIIVTEHRAAILGAVILLLMFMLFGRTQKIKLWMKLAVLILLVFLFHERVGDYLARRFLLDDAILLDGSAQKRLVMWRFALNLFHRSPIFGVGPLQYLPAAMNTPAQAITPHNYYLTLLAEQGLTGLLAFLTMAGLVLGRGLANLRRLATPALRRFNAGLLAGLFYYLFVLFFGGGRLTHNNVIYMHSFFWLATAALWMLPRLQRHEDALLERELRACEDVQPEQGYGESGPPRPAPGLESNPR